MPQQMKFWELTSAFRHWPAILREVLDSPRWRDYLRQYDQFDILCDTQNRRVLDAIVPLELSREVAMKCPARFAFNPGNRHLYAALEDGFVEPGLRAMSAVEVHDEYGGFAIEEVYEYGSWPVDQPTFGRSE